MRDGKERERKRGGRREIWRGNSCFIIIRLCNSDERRDRSSSAVAVLVLGWAVRQQAP